MLYAPRSAIVTKPLMFLAFPIALLHWYFGTVVLKRYGGGETLSFYLALLAGPCATLPALLAALWRPHQAGVFLRVGGAVSALSWTVAYLTACPTWKPISLQYYVAFLVLACLPMVALGGSLRALRGADHGPTDSTPSDQRDRVRSGLLAAALLLGSYNLLLAFRALTRGDLFLLDLGQGVVVVIIAVLGLSTTLPGVLLLRWKHRRALHLLLGGTLVTGMGVVCTALLWSRGWNPVVGYLLGQLMPIGSIVVGWRRLAQASHPDERT